MSVASKSDLFAAQPSWRTYAQLVRLPNVFTAFADISLSAVVTHASPDRGVIFLCLLVASGCLYCAGMVWNDYFDVEQDRRERPFRPLPSGKVSLARAAGIGAVLLCGGVLFALLADHARTGALFGSSTQLASALIVAILLYDRFLKRSWAGPLGMGLCRFLNVLLGLSILAPDWPSWTIHLATVVGVYIVGVTWFARTEANKSNRRHLTGAAAVMLAALLVAVPLPARDAVQRSSVMFPYLLVAFGFAVGFPVFRAIRRPSPVLVQAAVKRAILGLIALDAILCTAFAGEWGLLLLLLLPPALYLGRWIYST